MVPSDAPKRRDTFLAPTATSTTSRGGGTSPLGAAVALEVVRIIQEEGLIERGRRVAARLAAGLDGIQGRTGRIREIRQRGLMAAIELHDMEDVDGFLGHWRRC